MSFIDSLDTGIYHLPSSFTTYHLPPINKPLLADGTMVETFADVSLSPVKPFTSGEWGTTPNKSAGPTLHFSERLVISFIVGLIVCLITGP